ncbi:MAG: hypothetical protein WA268_15670 [Xanthobacteraceae bacterium]
MLQRLEVLRPYAPKFGLPLQVALPIAIAIEFRAMSAIGTLRRPVRRIGMSAFWD